MRLELILPMPVSQSKVLLWFGYDINFQLIATVQLESVSHVSIANSVQDITTDENQLLKGNLFE